MAQRTACRIGHAAWIVLLITASGAAQNTPEAPGQASPIIAPTTLPAPKPGCEGTVELQVVIDGRGRVRDPHVVRNSGCADLRDTAIEATKLMRMSPAKVGGTPVTIKALMEIHFQAATVSDHWSFQPAVATFHPDPAYPEKARKRTREGTVVISAAVDNTGTVTSAAEISKKLGDGLDKSAIQTVKTWKFRPATREGQAVSSEVTVSFSFHLTQPGSDQRSSAAQAGPVPDVTVKTEAAPD